MKLWGDYNGRWPVHASGCVRAGDHTSREQIGRVLSSGCTSWGPRQRNPLLHLSREISLWRKISHAKAACDCAVSRHRGGCQRGSGQRADHGGFADPKQERGFFRRKYHKTLQIRDCPARDLWSGRGIFSNERSGGLESVRLYGGEFLDAAFRGDPGGGRCGDSGRQCGGADSRAACIRGGANRRAIVDLE